MNPMVRKELNQRMREKRGWVLPTLYLVVLSAVILVAYFFSVEEARHRQPQGAELGVVIFLTTMYSQLSLLLLLAPIFSAAAITIEKEQRTYASLLTTLLTPVEIWNGKFISAGSFLVMLVIAALPVLSLVFAFGGVGLRELAMGTVSTLLVVAAVITVGLYCSSFFRRSVHATAVAYIVVVALAAVTAVAYAIMQTMWQQAHPGAGGDEMPWYIRLPLYMNPYFLQTIGFSAEDKSLAQWMYSAAFFIGLGGMAVLATLRNLDRPDETA